MIRKFVGALVFVLIVGFVSILYPFAWATVLPVESQGVRILSESMNVLSAFSIPVLVNPVWWVAAVLAGVAVAQSRIENSAA